MSKVWVATGPGNFNTTSTDLLANTDSVQLPEINEGSINDASNIFVSRNIIVHDGYEDVDGILIYDISLIELDRVIHFTDEIRPICLYDAQ